MSDSKFWIENKNDTKMNSNLYVSLVKLLPKGSQYYNQIIPNFLKILRDIIESYSFKQNNNSPFTDSPQWLESVLNIIDIVFFELVELITESNAQN